MKKNFILMTSFILLLGLTACNSSSVSCSEGTTLVNGQCIEEEEQQDLITCETDLSVYNAQNFNLVWSDEFDYEGKLDDTKWEYMIGNGGMYGLPGWGNDEDQYYTDSLDNVRVGDGLLTITASTNSFAQYEYTSGRVRTKDKADFTYGVFEICAKMPDVKGTWPAIWMLPTDSPHGGWPYGGEIDIMEAVLFENDTVHWSIHTKAHNWGDNQSLGTHGRIDDITTEFHRYAIKWDENSITFYTDGVEAYTFNPATTGDPNYWPFDTDFHILLNIAVGGTWGGAQGIQSGDWETTMEVDYVRVYQEQN